MIKGKKILVTGGSGFIGTNLCQKLVQNNQITIFDNFLRNAITYTELEKHKNIKIIKGDIRDKQIVKEVTREMSIVIHLAAIAGVSEYYNNPLEVIMVNYHGTKNILDSLDYKNIELFIEASTSEIYGKNANYVDEKNSTSSFSPDEMRSVYGKSKSLAEQLSFCYSIQNDFPLLSIRPFNIYGPGQIGEGAISNMVQRALKNETIKVTGDGSPIRAWCYISDFIDSILASIEKRSVIKTEALNIGNPTEIQTTLNLAKMIKRITNSSSEIVLVEHIGIDIPIRIPNIDKARNLMNFEPIIGLEKGIEKTASWWKTINKND